MKSSNNPNPESSIIVLNYNTGEILKKCVESILKTTKNLSVPRCELILIDNASSDESIKSIKGTKSIKGIKTIQNSQNLGFSKGFNQGIRIARGKYVLLLNPDTEVKPGAIQKLLEFAKNTPDAAVVAPKLLNPDGSTQASAFKLPTLWNAVREYWLGEKGLFSKYIPQGGPTESLVMAAYLLTPRALKKVGLLNEKFFMYFEDLDYAKRVKEKGLKIYYLPQAEVIHYHGVSGKNLADEKNQWRRLIPSSKTYHGTLMHYLINLVIWSSQKWEKAFHEK